MPDTPAPSAHDVALLLQEAARGGHVTITIMPDTRSRLDHALTLPPQQRSPEIALALTCRLTLGLTLGEALMLVPLLKQTHATKEELHAAMSLDGKPATNIKIVDVVVYKLRQKLGRHGVQIINVYGIGYRLPETARERVRKLLAQHGADIVAATTPAPASQSD